MPKIDSKIEMYRRLFAGEYGNSAWHWTLAEYLDGWASRYRGRFAVRTAMPKPGPCYANILRSEVLASVRRAMSPPHNARRDQVFLNSCPPVEAIQIQGELWIAPPVCRSRDKYLFYTTKQLVMREALKVEQLHAQGRDVDTVLQDFLGVDASETLIEVARLYPNHVVEFGGYHIAIGQARNYFRLVEPRFCHAREGRKVVVPCVWEVRSY